MTRGWIGVQIQPVTSDIADSLGLKTTKGALVAEVQPNGPAKSAGIKSGDVILGVNGEAVDGPRELARKIAALGPNAKVDLLVWRNGSEKTVSMTLGTLPNEQVAKAEPGAGTRRQPALGLRSGARRRPIRCRAPASRASSSPKSIPTARRRRRA